MTYTMTKNAEFGSLEITFDGKLSEKEWKKVMKNIKRIIAAFVCICTVFSVSSFAYEKQNDCRRKGNFE